MGVAKVIGVQSKICVNNLIKGLSLDEFLNKLTSYDLEKQF